MCKHANIVGQNLVKLRHQAGWTQEGLAGKIQLRGHYLTREIIANIESRRSAVTDKSIALFAEVFDVEISCLFQVGAGQRMPLE